MSETRGRRLVRPWSGERDMTGKPDRLGRHRPLDGFASCGCPTLETYAYVPEEVGHEDHDVFRVTGEVRRDP
jgi:hypothetical protein